MLQQGQQGQQRQCYDDDGNGSVITRMTAAGGKRWMASSRQKVAADGNVAAVFF